MEKHNQNLKVVCIKARQFKNTKVVNDIISFDNRVGVLSL